MLVNYDMHKYKMKIMDKFMMLQCIAITAVTALDGLSDTRAKSQPYETFCTLSLHQNAPLDPKNPTQEPPQKRNS